MMEQWNSGVMGYGIMQCWINGPAIGGIDDNIKMAIILLIANIWRVRKKSNFPIYLDARLRSNDNK
jgi:hypothetical protein